NGYKITLMFNMLLRSLRPKNVSPAGSNFTPSISEPSPTPPRQDSRWRAVLGIVAGAAALSLLGWLLQLRASDIAADSAKADKGVSYQNDRVASEPWSIHIAKMDRRDPTLELHSTLAKGTILGLSTVSE